MDTRHDYITLGLIHAPRHSTAQHSTAQHSTAQHAWSWSWSCVAYHAAQSHHAACYLCTMGAAWPVLAYIDQSCMRPLNAYTCTMHTDTHTTDKSAPMTASQRVIKANKALLSRGGKRMPGGYLQPDTAQVLATRPNFNPATMPHSKPAQA